jgi:hypothetical protein
MARSLPLCPGTAAGCAFHFTQFFPFASAHLVESRMIPHHPCVPVYADALRVLRRNPALSNRMDLLPRSFWHNHGIPHDGRAPTPANG